MTDLPNIVLVVFDTARWDRFGCYGYDRPTTPAVDALARDGLLVRTMIAQAPWTLPSHASLFTGLYPSEHGSQWQTGPRLRERAAPTIAEWLKGLGYETVCATNNGLISSRTGLARGFDRYAFRLDLERGWRRAARRVPKALFGGDSGGRIMNRWIRRTLPEVRRPMFLFVNYLECHWSYAPPARFARRVGGPRFGPLEGLRYRTRVAARVGPWEAVARAGDDARTLGAYSTYFDGELANADDHLRELVGILTDTGHLGTGSTVLLVTSDHGEHIGEHGLADHHASLDDHLLRVPFVAWAPGIVPAGERGRLYETVDVLPSLARMLGKPVPAGHLEGRRSDLFEAETRTFGEEYAFAEWRSWPDGEAGRLASRNPSYGFSPLRRDLVAVRDRRFKLVRGSDGTEVLHDLASDPEEGEDVSSTRRETIRRLSEQLDRALSSWKDWEGERAPETTPQEEAEIEQRLSELGYI
ncbi:MAG: sulfatase [Actinobacteria bacterium]|nr:sulfatase [Actinomycetota bacterium]